MVERFILNELIIQCEEELEKRATIAHASPLRLRLDGEEETFNQGMINAVYAQGKKDALRSVLIELKSIRGYN